MQLATFAQQLGFVLLERGALLVELVGLLLKSLGTVLQVFEALLERGVVLVEFAGPHRQLFLARLELGRARIQIAAPGVVFRFPRAQLAVTFIQFLGRGEQFVAPALEGVGPGLHIGGPFVDVRGAAFERFAAFANRLGLLLEGLLVACQGGLSPFEFLPRNLDFFDKLVLALPDQVEFLGQPLADFRAVFGDADVAVGQRRERVSDQGALPGEFVLLAGELFLFLVALVFEQRQVRVPLVDLRSVVRQQALLLCQFAFAFAQLALACGQFAEARTNITYQRLYRILTLQGGDFRCGSTGGGGYFLRQVVLRLGFGELRQIFEIRRVVVGSGHTDRTGHILPHSRVRAEINLLAKRHSRNANPSIIAPIGSMSPAGLWEAVL